MKGANFLLMYSEATVARAADPEENNDSSAGQEVCVGCSLGRCGKLMGVITSLKRLLVFKVSSSSCWSLQHSWQLLKKPTDLTFDADSQHILVAGNCC